MVVTMRPRSSVGSPKGLDLGQLLCLGGRGEEGKKILLQSREGFMRLGWAQYASMADEALKHCEGQHDDSPLPAEDQELSDGP